MTAIERRNFLKGATALGFGALVAGTWSPATGVAETTLSDLDFLGEPGRWNSYSREREPTTDVIQAVEFTLGQNTYPSGAHLILVADTVNLIGNISTGGRDIVISARRINCAEGTAIDASGADAIFNAAPAAAGNAPGQKGSDGATGDVGGRSGNVTIAAGTVNGLLTVLANGGRGAKGQKGGSGTQGATGAKGARASSRGHHKPGDQGGQGGAAGNGGAGGSGGDPGVIRCLVLETPVRMPSLSAKGGIGGEEGDPGQPGGKGRGGLPGDNCYNGFEADETGRRRRPVEYCDRTAVPSGPDGLPGVEATQPNEPGRTPLSLIPQLSLGKSNELFGYVSINTLLMSLRRCELDALNEGDVSEIVSQAEWIEMCVASPSCGKTFYESKRRRMASQEVGEPSPAELQAVGGQAAAIVSNLRLGLDVFGNAPHYVSDLTSEFLKRQSSEWIQIATTIQTAYLSLLDKNTSLDEKSRQLGVARQQVINAYDAGKRAILAGQQNIGTIQDDILKLGSRVLELQQIIEQADADFKRAVAARAGGCSLENMITFVMGVVTIATAIYTGYGALTGMMAGVNSMQSQGSGVRGMISDFKVMGKSFKDSGLKERYAEMQKGFDQVKEGLKTDETKIVVSLEAFEEQLAPYLGMPEAVRYRDLMRQLANVAQSKNSKQYELTQIVEQIAKEQAEQTGRRLESDRIGRLVGNSNNPAMTECVVFLGRFLEQTKRQILRVTDLQRRGLSYLTCTPIKLSYQTSRVEELLVPQVQLGEVWLRALQEQGGARQSMDADFEVTRHDDPAFFKSLAAKGMAVFSVPLDDPSFNRGGTSFVQATEVGLSIDFGDSVKTFTCRLTHSGTSLVRDKAGKVLNFLHSRRPTILSYARDTAGGWVPTASLAGNLRGDERYISLSPFTTWTVEFDPIDGVEWDKVTRFACAFKLTLIPSSQTYRPEDALKSIRP